MSERLEYTDIIIEKKYPIGYVILNRPEKRNALVTAPGGTIEQLQQAFLEMRDDPEIRVFIIKGNGDCFCAGFDLSRYDDGMFKPQTDLPESVKWAEAVKDEPWSRYGRVRGSLANPEGVPMGGRDMFWDCLWDNPTPSIAQVHSFCYGAGLWLINECDIVYSTPTSIFAYPPIRYGASVVLGILPPWLLGRRRGMWMALTGHSITADEAYNAGLITKIVDEGKIDKEVTELATSIAKVPPATHIGSKRAINNYWENQGILQAERYGAAWVNMTENSAVPGHYYDFFQKVRTMGLREALKVQREQWSYPDPIMDKEIARLREQNKPK